MLPGHGREADAFSECISDLFEASSSAKFGSNLTGLEWKAVEHRRELTERLTYENEAFQGYIQDHVFPTVVPETSYTGAVCSHRRTVKAAFAGRLSSEHPASRQELDLESKCHVIRTQSLLLEKDMKQYMEKCEQILAEFRAKLDGYNIRFSEIGKFKEDFACSIISDERPVNGSTVEAECLLRYQENFTRGRDTLISKYKLQNPLLRNRLRRMERQTRQIEMTGKLPKVEFSAIRQENESCINQLRTVSKEIMQTKALRLTISLTAQGEWEKLKAALQDNARMMHEMWRKKSMVQRVQEQYRKYTGNHVVEAFVNRRLLRKVKCFRAPSVWNFIDAVLEEAAVDREFKIAERRRYISRIIHRKNKDLLFKQLYSSEECSATSGYGGSLGNGKRRMG